MQTTIPSVSFIAAPANSREIAFSRDAFRIA